MAIMWPYSSLITWPLSLRGQRLLWSFYQFLKEYVVTAWLQMLLRVTLLPIFCRGGAWVRGYKIATISLYTNMAAFSFMFSKVMTKQQRPIQYMCTHSPSYCWTSPVCFSLISPPPSALPHTSHEYVCDQARSEPLMRRITCLELVSFPDLPSVRYWEFHWGPGNETRMTLAIHWALLPGLCPRAHSLLPDSCLCGSLTLRFSWSSFFFKSADHHLNLLTEVMWQLCNIMWDHVMDGHVTLCDGHVTHETWNKVHVLHVGLTLSLSSLKASRSSRSLVIIAAAYIIAVNVHVK